MIAWRHIFVDEGEYASPEKILTGLTLEQVTYLPSTQSHSIYDELWHVSKWQRIVVFRDEALYESWQKGELVYPKHSPSSEREWDELVKEFFAGLREALEWTQNEERLRFETDPGITMADNLVSLAVHNAYHLGKIVALRQMMRIWPST
jgi:uncharacterized damage-inducible protein DinB